MRGFDLAPLAGREGPKDWREDFAPKSGRAKARQIPQEPAPQNANFDNPSRTVLPLTGIKCQQMAFEQNLVDFMGLAPF